MQVTSLVQTGPGASSSLAQQTVMHPTTAPNTFIATQNCTDEIDELLTAVQNMAYAQPEYVFASNYVLSTEHVHGGQSVVVFARGVGPGMRHYAIKCGPP